MNGAISPDADQSDLGFSPAALALFLRDKLPGFDNAQVRRLQGGQSNPTYQIDTQAGSYVLRKKPAGELVPSAHAVDREYRVMGALAGEIPVPRMRLLCEDPGVIGQSFYIMDYVQGRILPDARMLGVPVEQRRDLCLEMVSVLARLHQVDYRAVGLEGFGRPEGYAARQLARWSKQFAAARFEENADMDRLIPWLETNLPAADEAAIVHGDYRSHNLIYAMNESRVAAVLDWELATIGHPLADLAYCCLPYHLPPQDARGFHGESLEVLGIPPEQELLSAYCREAGRDGLPDWRFYLVFALFRSASIRAGLYKRALDGTAVDPAALAHGQGYRDAAACAWRLAQSNGTG